MTDDKKPAVKYDSEKPRVAEMLLDFDSAVVELAKVWAFGANKYAASQWKRLPNAETRYKNALVRHLLQTETEPTDSESGLSHYHHIACNAMFLLWLEIQKGKQK